MLVRSAAWLQTMAPRAAAACAHSYARGRLLSRNCSTCFVFFHKISFVPCKSGTDDGNYCDLEFCAARSPKRFRINCVFLVYPSSDDQPIELVRTHGHFIRLSRFFSPSSVLLWREAAAGESSERHLGRRRRPDSGWAGDGFTPCTGPVENNLNRKRWRN